MVHELVDAVIAFPKYLVSNLIALLTAILTDWDTTSLVIATILLCFVINPLVAIAGALQISSRRRTNT